MKSSSVLVTDINCLPVDYSPLAFVQTDIFEYNYYLPFKDQIHQNLLCTFSEDNEFTAASLSFYRITIQA